MATIAYLRVSTEGQDLDQQRLAILDYAQKYRITVDAFVEMQRSSQQAIQRTELMEMIEALRSGDRLIVSELSRFGRSLSQICRSLIASIQKDVRLVAIKEAIRFEGKHNLQTKAMIALFGLFAEIERDLIAQRTKEGLAAAKARGKRLGRPKGAEHLETRWQGRRNPVTAAQKRLEGFHRSDPGRPQTTLHHFIKTRNLQPKTATR